MVSRHTSGMHRCDARVGVLRLSHMWTIALSIGLLAVSPMSSPASAPADTSAHYESPEALRHYLAGRWLELSGSTAEALGEYNRALSLDPNSVGVLLRLAAVGEMAAGIAHEIRNPLAGIGTSAQVLYKRFEPGDDRARFVQVILDEVARLDRIVTSLLQYARPRQPELRPTRLAEVVERVLAVQRERAERQGVKVEVDVAPRLASVYIDADLIQQVLHNVTTNALQAMPSGGALRYEVRLVRRRRIPRGAGRRAEDASATPMRRASDRRAETFPGESAWIETQQVRVIDTGVGIPRGNLAKMFDPFFTTKASGTGLGLSISQTIMQEHGGSIAVDSKEGRGTTVLLNFPLEKRNGERRQLDAGESQGHAARRR